MLTHFAEDDLKRIAATIQNWMANDAKEKDKIAKFAKQKGKNKAGS